MSSEDSAITEEKTLKTKIVALERELREVKEALTDEKHKGYDLERKISSLNSREEELLSIISNLSMCLKNIKPDGKR